MEGAGPRIIITYSNKRRTAIRTTQGLTDGISLRCMINPGSGDIPVCQFDAQNLFPKGKGMPSLANSMKENS